MDFLNIFFANGELLPSLGVDPFYASQTTFKAKVVKRIKAIALHLDLTIYTQNISELSRHDLKWNRNWAADTIVRIIQTEIQLRPIAHNISEE